MTETQPRKAPKDADTPEEALELILEGFVAEKAEDLRRALEPLSEAIGDLADYQQQHASFDDDRIVAALAAQRTVGDVAADLEQFPEQRDFSRRALAMEFAPAEPEAGDDAA